LRLDRGKGLLIDHRKRKRGGQHDHQRRRQPDPGRTAVKPPQQGPGEHRHDNPCQRDQRAAPHQIAKFAQIDHQRAHCDQHEIA